MRLLITFCVLLFAQFFCFSANASVQHNKTTLNQRKSYAVNHNTADKKKSKPVSNKKKNATVRDNEKSNLHHHSMTSSKPSKARNETRKIARKNTNTANSTSKKHHYQRAKQTAMNKLMQQIGKPYHWGGKSPLTGFDCSGLVYYAYQDLVNIKMPRTANEMYHLRDAAQVKKGELERGDLVFFRLRSQNNADHVGVYLGDGKFIQSPRTGKDIQISYLSDDYWQEHYLGARRVITPQTIR